MAIKPDKKGKVTGTKKKDKITWLSSKDWKRALTVNAGAGNDVINFKKSKYKNKLNGDAGNDVIYGGSANDIISGGIGTDVIYTGKGKNTVLINKGDGKDTIYNQGTTNTIKFTTSNKKDVISFTKSAKDLIMTYTHVKAKGDKKAISETVTFKSYFDAKGKIVKDTTYLLNVLKNTKSQKISALLKSKGVLQTIKKAGKYYGTAYNDSITGSKYAETVYGGAGKDTINTGKGNDCISGGAGNDIINAGKGSNKIYFYKNEGTDTVKSGGGVDTLVFSKETDFNNLTFAYINNNKDLKISATGTNVVLKDYASGGHSAKYAKVGSNTYDISSVIINDSINIDGSSGNDLIFAKGTADDQFQEIRPGSGNDTIYGSSNTNVYYFENETGNKTIYASDISENNIVWMYMGQGNDTIYAPETNEMKVYLRQNLGNQGDNTIYYRGGAISLLCDGEENTGLTYSDFNYLRPQGTNDLMFNYENTSITIKDYYLYNDSKPDNFTMQYNIPGGGDVDVSNLEYIIANSGGVKTLVDGVTGTDGDDYIIGTDNADTISPGAGNDIIVAKGGDDVIEASSGNDIINLGSGNTTVKIDTSMLDITIHDEGEPWEWRECVENCVKTIYLRDDSVLTLDFAKEIFDNGCSIFCRGTGQDNDLYISLTNAAEPPYGIVIKNYFDENGNPKTDNVKLNIWEGGETPTSYTVPEWANADLIPWLRVFDIQPFSEYTGEIHGTNMPHETLLYSAGFGDDIIYGGNGNEEYIFLHGGNDIVYANEGIKHLNISGNATNCEIHLGTAETTKTSINIGLVEGNVTSSINAEGDLNVSWDCYANNAIEPYVYTSTLSVIDWNNRTSEALFSISGNNRDNTLNAVDGADNMLNGEEGDDILIGGTGVDTFNFTYNSGYGIDTVRNYTSDDILRFESASSYGVDFTKFKYYTSDNGNALVINTKDLNNKDSYVIIDNYFESDNKIDTVTTHNWSSPDETKSLATMYGNKDDLGSFDVGTDGAFTGTDNVDVFIAKSGTNTYTGGKGADTLLSRNGENTFVFNAGDGSDTLYQEGGNITLMFNDATIEELTSKTGYDKGDGHTTGYDDLLIHYDGENTLIVKDFYWKNHNYVVKIIDSTGTEYNMTDCFKGVKNIHSSSDYYTYPPTNKDDDIRILADNTGIIQIEGKAGSDRIWGSNDDEVIFSHKSDYSCDTISGVVDEIHAGGGDDIIYARSDKNIVYGDAGDDYIFVNTSQTSIIYDSDGDDTISINPVDGESDEANYQNLHFVFNVDSSGKVDTKGLRILTTDDFELWKANTNDSNIKDISIAADSEGNGWDCIETIIDYNDYALNISTIKTLKSEIAGWLFDKGYENVSDVFAEEKTAGDITTLIGKFDTVNNPSNWVHQ